METENKFFETGSNPYYLNLNNSAKEFSTFETTNPSTGLLDILSKFTIIQNQYSLESVQIQEEYSIEKQSS